MSKKIIFLLLMIGLGIKANAQENQLTKFEEYIPPSPTSEEFMKYGDYPVSLNVGIPNISIPLYEVSVKDMKVPISLSYHASGIKVDQTATWVGLGWSLNAQGTVSKIPKGRPDDESNGFLTYNVPERKDLAYEYSFFETAATGERDTESDMYQYNVGGYSGRFFFDRGHEAVLIEEHPIQVQRDNEGFVIKTPDGKTYTLKEREYTESVTNTSPGGGGSIRYVSTWHLTKILSKTKKDSIRFIYEQDYPFATNRYNYSESVGDKIVVNEHGTISKQQNIHEQEEMSSQSVTTYTPKRLRKIDFPNGEIMFDRSSDRLDVGSSRLTKIRINEKIDGAVRELKSYDFQQDYFYSGQTTFYPGISNNSRRYRLRLDALIENPGNGGSGEDLKKHYFRYNETQLPPLETNAKDLWGYYNGANTNVGLVPVQDLPYFGFNIGSANRDTQEAFMKAGVLTKITYPTGGYTEFDYEANRYKSMEFDLIRKTAMAEAKGLNNGQGNLPYLEQEITFAPNYSGPGILTIEATDIIEPDGEFAMVSLKEQGASTNMVLHYVDPYGYNLPLNPPSVTKTFAPVSVLKGKTYVLKVRVKGTSSGSDHYEGAAYVRAHFRYMELPSSPTYATKLAGGLRVTSITSYDDGGNFAFAKRYTYGEGRLLTHESFLKEQSLEREFEIGFPDLDGVGCRAWGGTKRNFFSGTVRDLSFQSGSPVMYKEVEESNTDVNGNDLGKTVYSFHFKGEDYLPVPYAYLGGIMTLDNDWERGQLMEKRTFAKDASGPDDFLVLEENGYTVKTDPQEYMMYKIVHKMDYSGCHAPSPFRYEIVEYPIKAGRKLLSRIRRTEKFDNGEAFSEVTHTFENDVHLLPSKSESSGSNGDIVVERTRYADDFNTSGQLIDNTTLLGGPLSQDALDALERMKREVLNQAAIPIQKEKYRIVGGVEKPLSITRWNFVKSQNDIVYLETQQLAKGTEALQDRVEYLEYDDKANPTKMTRTDGIPLHLVWGYQGARPIIKIEGAKDTDLTAQVLSLIADCKNLSGTENSETRENDLRTAQELLRSALPNALVTTYTYDPIIGITSVTDPMGNTQYFGYDGFNRLKTIKDTDKELTTDYKYHYKNQ